MSLSVFTACRNHGRFLEESADSCLTQSSPPDEMILINDGSTDNSLEVMYEIKDKYPGIVTVIDHKKKIGHIAAYNEGIQSSKGKFIHLMAADDRLCYEDFYKDSLRVLKNDNIGFSTGRLTAIDQASNIIGGAIVGPPLFERQKSVLWLKELALRGNFICGGAVVVRKDLQMMAGLYDDRLPFSADFLNWIKILQICESAFSLPRVVYHYRKHFGQMTNRHSAPEAERQICAEELKKALHNEYTEQMSYIQS
jgi:glycosyltransferase involved in cell wall biosynthesis